MVGPRLLPGGVTARSALLRLDGWRWPHVPLAFEPDAPDARWDVEPAPTMPGESNRWAVRIEGLRPDTVYRIGLRAGAQPAAETGFVRIRTAPERLAGGTGLLIGLASCYFPSDEYWTNGRAVVDCLEERARRPFLLGAAPAPDSRRALPHATFLCGDQIYADVPRAPGRSRVGLYRGRYADAWQASRLGPVLERGGNFFTADDHEFWNGYPERMFWLSRSWNRSWRETARIAGDAFLVHQGAWNHPPELGPADPEGAAWTRGQLGEVDLFVADARSMRTDRKARRCPDRIPSGGACAPDTPPSAMGRRQLDALIDWLTNVRRVGLLVLPQPLAQTGGRFDSALSDFSSTFERVRRGLSRTVQRGASVVVLTGDIHWGRLVSWQPATAAPGRLVEFVASPIARVGLLSILHSRFDVGAARDPTGRPRPEELAVMAPEFDPARATRHFATGENNFGLMELREGPGGRVTARFELWSLSTKRPAVNRWGSAGGACLAELLL